MFSSKKCVHSNHIYMYQHIFSLKDAEIKKNVFILLFVSKLNFLRILFFSLIPLIADLEGGWGGAAIIN